jgi:hypothetical protein
MPGFDSTKTKLAGLLEDIIEGKLQLPDFKRGWMWDNEHIRSLLIADRSSQSPTAVYRHPSSAYQLEE